jgi:hypothetical protein
MDNLLDFPASQFQGQRLTVSNEDESDVTVVHRKYDTPSHP